MLDRLIVLCYSSPVQAKDEIEKVIYPRQYSTMPLQVRNAFHQIHYVGSSNQDRKYTRELSRKQTRL